MIPKYWMTAILLLLMSTLTAQINFLSIDFNQAKEKAYKENKLLLLQIESKDCIRCNEVASIGLSSKTIQLLTEDRFVALKLGKIPNELYNSGSPYLFDNNFFGIIFLNPNGDLLHLMNYSTTLKSRYEDNITDAIAANKKIGTPLSMLDSIYRERQNFSSLYQLIHKIREFNLEVRQDLLDSLVHLTSGDSASSKEFLAFVINCAPEVYSPTYAFVRDESKVFDELWHKIPVKNRISINERMVNKSIQKAINERNEGYADQVAHFSEVVNDGGVAGKKAYERTMLRYYLSTNDTARYLVAATKYYDQFFMSVSVDSVVHSDLNKKSRLDAIAKRNAMRGAPLEMRTYTFNEETQYYSKELNSGAWNVYLFTNDKNYIQTALSWAKRAIKFYKTPDVLDTYARLLYKLGKKKEAIQWETQAVELAGQGNRNKTKTEYANVLQRMALNEKTIDTY